MIHGFKLLKKFWNFSSLSLSIEIAVKAGLAQSGQNQ